MVRNTLHKRFLLLLLFSVCGLVVIHLSLMFRAHVLGQGNIVDIAALFDVNLAYWFNLDYEKRFGAIFSTLLILTASGCTLFACWRSLPDKVMAAGWMLIASVLIFMACDEYFSIHEKTGDYFGVGEQFGATAVPGWVQVMSVVVLALLIPMGLFWWKLSNTLKWRTAAAAIVFLTGAMGVEILASSYVMHLSSANFPYHLLVVTEEGLEMLGMVIMIDAMLLHLLGATPQSAPATKPTSIAMVNDPSMVENAA